MNDYHTMLVFRQQLKDAEHRRQQEQYKQDARAANQHVYGLSLSWLKQIIHQAHLPKITLARPLPARHPAIGD
jgi:hypothetical protein